MSPPPPSHRSLSPRLVAVTAVVAIAALLRFVFDDPAPPPAASHRVDVRATIAPEPMDSAADDSARLAQDVPQQAEPEPAPVDLELPNPFSLHLRVVDAVGLPVEGARLFVAPSLCGFGLCQDVTDARGQLVFACRGRATTLQLWVAVMAFGTVDPLRLLTLSARQQESLTVAVRSRHSDPTELLDLLDRGVSSRDLQSLAKWRRADDPQRPRAGRMRRRGPEDTICGREVFLFRQVECTACHEPSRVAAYQPLRWAPRLEASLHPHAVFRDLLLHEPQSRGRKPLDDEIAARKPEAYAVRLAQEFGEGHLGTVAGIVRRAGGAPAPDVQVVWMAGDGAVRQRTVTSGNGHYRLTLPGGGPCTLVAAGGPLGRAETIVAAPTGGEGRQDFDLQTQQVVRGHAVDDQGAPLIEWRVQFAGVDEAGAAVTQTDQRGAFAFSHLPRSGRCLLWPKDDDLRLPVLVTEPLSPDASDLTLKLSAHTPTRARLRLHPRLPAGHERARVEIRLLQVDSGLATHLEASGFDDAFDLEGLAEGLYQGEVGAQGLGWVSFGPVHLDGRGLWDLGVIHWPPPGRIRFDLQNGARLPLALGATFVHRRDDTDVLAAPTPVDGTTVALPAGNYALLWIEDEVLRSRQMRVAAGEQTVVTIAR